MFEESKMMDGPGHLLRPDAPAFHPLYEPVHLAIYNDGVPSMVLTSEYELNKIVHGIQDDAIDEGFPPDALDAAELDEADAFVEQMAVLAMMEEQEEKARFEFNHIKKRWEVRRAEGLHGRRPKPAKHVVTPVEHKSKDLVTLHIKAIVPHSSYHSKFSSPEHHVRFNDKRVSKMTPPVAFVPPPVSRSVIQQPRKGY